MLRVKGLAELNRDLGKVSKSLQRDFQKAVREEIAEPVAEDVRSKAAKFGPRITRTIRAGTRRGGAVVTQRAHKSTGRRPDFGAIQMREAFIPAVDENEAETVKRVEHFLDRIIDDAGF